MRGGTFPVASGRAPDKGIKNDGKRAQGKRHDETHSDPMGEHLGVNGEKCYGGKEERGRRQASRRKPENDRPVDMVGKMVTPTPGRLGDGSIEQVGADSDLGAYAEARDEERRHERAAADPGQAHEQAHSEAGRDERQQGDCPAQVAHN